MKKFIYNIIGLTLIATGATGCSDNYNDIYEPTKTTKVLTITPESSNYSSGNLTVASYQSQTTVEVVSNTLWKVEVDCTGGWCDASAFNGSGNGSFEISVLENLTDEVRKCTVTVYTVDKEGNRLTGTDGASDSFVISQNYSNVRLTPSSVEPFEATNPESQTFQIVADEEIEWTLTLTYEESASTEFMNVLAGNGMTKVSDNEYIGNGNSSFTLSLDRNRIAADRIGFLKLDSKVSTYIVEIRQLGSDYTFDVTADSNSAVNADGGEVKLSVYAPLIGWEINGAPDWIEFTPTSADANDERVNVTAKVAFNASVNERSAVVSFVPVGDNSNLYQKIDMQIVQNGNSFPFSVDASDTLGVVSENGDEKSIELDSRFDWIIDHSSWIEPSRSSGTGSDTIQKITVVIGKDNEGHSREGTIKIIPQTTVISGIEVNPADLGITTITLTVTQFGGMEPAVSSPWLSNGYTQNSATVEFNYFSPFYEVTGAGIQWKEASADWSAASTVEAANISGTSDGNVVIELDNLTANTQYVVRGYVKYLDGETEKTVYGVATVEFTTAGTRPGANDNPTPGV